MRNQIIALVFLLIVVQPAKAHSIYCFVDATLSVEYQNYIVGGPTLVTGSSERDSIDFLRRVFKHSVTKYNVVASAAYYNFLLTKLKNFYAYYLSHGLESPTELEILEFLRIAAHNAFQGYLSEGNYEVQDPDYILNSRLTSLFQFSILGATDISFPRTEDEITDFALEELSKFGIDFASLKDRDLIVRSLKQRVEDFVAAHPENL